MAIRNEAIELCRLIEEFCPTYGYHVALTGGCLYKTGSRKDIDILFYRIRQETEPKRDSLLLALIRRLGMKLGTHHGWVQKMIWQDVPIDMFFPEDFPPGEGYPIETGIETGDDSYCDA